MLSESECDLFLLRSPILMDAGFMGSLAEGVNSAYKDRKTAIPLSASGDGKSEGRLLIDVSEFLRIHPKFFLPPISFKYSYLGFICLFSNRNNPHTYTARN